MLLSLLRFILAELSSWLPWYMNVQKRILKYKKTLCILRDYLI